MLDTHLLVAARIDDLLSGLSRCRDRRPGKGAARPHRAAGRSPAAGRGGLGHRRQRPRGGQRPGLPGKPRARPFRARGFPRAAGRRQPELHLGAAGAQPGARRPPAVFHGEPAPRQAGDGALPRHRRRRGVGRLFRLVLQFAARRVAAVFATVLREDGTSLARYPRNRDAAVRRAARRAAGASDRRRATGGIIAGGSPFGARAASSPTSGSPTTPSMSRSGRTRASILQRMAGFDDRLCRDRLSGGGRLHAAEP